MLSSVVLLANFAQVLFYPLELPNVYIRLYVYLAYGDARTGSRGFRITRIGFFPPVPPSIRGKGAPPPVFERAKSARSYVAAEEELVVVVEDDADTDEDEGERKSAKEGRRPAGRIGADEREYGCMCTAKRTVHKCASGSVLRHARDPAGI